MASIPNSPDETEDEFARATKTIKCAECSATVEAPADCDPRVRDPDPFIGLPGGWAMPFWEGPEWFLCPACYLEVRRGKYRESYDVRKLEDDAEILTRANWLTFDFEGVKYQRTGELRFSKVIGESVIIISPTEFAEALLRFEKAGGLATAG